MTRTAELDIVLLSDLQLSERRSDTPTDVALPEMIRSLLAGPRPVSLVLLGDSFELPPPDCRNPHSPGERAADALSAIAEVHPLVFDALRSFLSERDVRLDVVAGNHDVALVLDKPQETLAHLLDPSGLARERLGFHPWYLHVPGVLHAQHGHQLHDLNAHPALLSPCLQPVIEVLGMPLGLQLDRIFGRDGSGMVARAAGAASALRWMASHSTATHVRKMRGLYRAEVLKEPVAEPTPAIPADASPVFPAREPLPPAVLRRMDEYADVTTARLLRRLLAKYLRKRDYMAPAVAQLAGLLEECDRGVPLYVMGHTHRPHLQDIPDHPAAYANCGTWLGYPEEWAGTMVRVTLCQDAVSRVALLRWDAARHQAVAWIDSEDEGPIRSGNSGPPTDAL